MPTEPHARAEAPRTHQNVPARLPLQLHILYNFSLFYTSVYITNKLQHFYSLTRPPFPTHKSNTPQPPKTLWPPQGASFRPLYSYKYSIFLWVTCSYRKECSLKIKDCLCCNNIYHSCSRWRCLHSLYNTFSELFKTFPPQTTKRPSVASSDYYNHLAALGR